MRKADGAKSSPRCMSVQDPLVAHNLSVMFSLFELHLQSVRSLARSSWGCFQLSGLPTGKVLNF